MVKPPSDPPLGPLLRLEGIDFDRLPSHDCSIDAIKPLIINLLKESLDFIGTVDVYDQQRDTKPNPSGWYPKGSAKFNGAKVTGGPDTVAVELLERDILQSELDAVVNQPYGGGNVCRKSTKAVSETWACRRSFHNNLTQNGTADWLEFLKHMKDEHVKTEDDMTDTVVGTNTAYTWNDIHRAMSIDLNALGMRPIRGPSVWTDFTLQVVEMKHDLGSKLFDYRVFPVLQMSCLSVQSAPHDEFLVISVPINGWGAAPVPHDGRKLANGPRTTIGSYVSVERFRLGPKTQPEAPLQKVSTFGKVKSSLRIKKLKPRPSVAQIAEAAPVQQAEQASREEGSAAGALQTADQAGIARDAVNPEDVPDNYLDNLQIEWVMATASHARGNIPLFVQKPFIPKKIAIDVPLFLKVMVNKREPRSPPTPPVGSQVANDEQAAGQETANQEAGHQATANPAAFIEASSNAH
ncbi:uncharacterized protein SPSK_09233 [Sporothrix schenckii 1099-18]|uniref:DUF3074 domain-containing protein n=1 Tax=Sporothrix schenckii 1099-18 TaxID=1397361 RepID=A0A0F2M8A7_SPOSC|nr:uncharacterized protein SPSK_09233 [Sporothrix schenckii 1099-18]KJR84411.1 hypothetical protein SPSK_09233 [Sporothrix schenckii 1099-18]